MLKSYGVVRIIDAPGAIFPRYAVAETGYKTDRLGRSDKSGYFVLGGFAVANNNGLVLGPSLFLRAAARNQMSQKTARSWATDIKQWVLFVEALQKNAAQREAAQKGGRVPSFEFDLMSVDEATLKRYRYFLTEIVTSHDGQRLTTATVRCKLQRICAMQQWFADNGWYHGDLGPRAEAKSKQFSVRPIGLLAHIHRGQPKAQYKGPMGSALAKSTTARRPQKLPRALTQSDQDAVERILKKRLDTVVKGSARYDQYVRDELIFNTGRFVGLRVENMGDLSVAKVLALRLSGLRDTDMLSMPLIGKFGRSIAPQFPVALLRQMQAYAETSRQRAIKKGKKREPSGLFVAHLGARAGGAITKRTFQKAMEELFIEAGLSRLVPDRTKSGEIIKNERGETTYHSVSRFSIHDLRHSCAARLFYAILKATEDRDQAMRAVQAQLCHVDIETTENEYAELTRRFTSWLTFSEGLSKQRAASPIIDDDDEILESFE